MKKIVILGANGFIGSHLLRRFCNTSYNVVGFDHSFDEELLHYKNDNVEFYKGDFFNSEDLQNVLKNADFCFHLISTSTPRTSNDNFSLDVKNNLCSTLTMLDIACACGVKKIIFASSGGAIYGNTNSVVCDELSLANPISSYGVIKLVIENYLSLYQAKYGLKFTVLRIANPYGPVQNLNKASGFIPVCLNKIYHRDPITIWGNGTAKKDFIYIDDVVDAFFLAMNCELSCNTFNIGTGKSFSLNSILKIAKYITNEQVTVNYIDSLDSDIQEYRLSIVKAKEKLFWSPKTSIFAGIKASWENIFIQTKSK